MKKDKVTYFKWDKAGDGISPHFMALLSIANDLRRENPRLFINTTVGTWPSPSGSTMWIPPGAAVRRT
ncbi:hypothetical protein ABFY27_09155 [Akkermansia massiliensis]